MPMAARPLQCSGLIVACRLVLQPSVLQNPAKPGDLMQYVEQSWDLCGALGLNYMKKCEPLQGSCLWRQLWFLMLLLFMNRLHVQSNFTFLCIQYLWAMNKCYRACFFVFFLLFPRPWLPLPCWWLWSTTSNTVIGPCYPTVDLEFFFFFIFYSNSNSN